ncbi:Qat anti-phage system QueC-like protein QatC [Candidatus Leptofilum sp.]|uniref:Qat anti-phage system QueC-like protein QatC n=1 Tax=Candidatus Leptofilum sp. TaxID=3241576 RepID=UPI003B5CF7E7
MDIQVAILPPGEQLLTNKTAVFEITIPELNVRQYLHLPFDEFHRFFNAPEGIEADLLVVAGIVYVVDQLVSRNYFPDNWTRDLSLAIPVQDPTLWGSVSELLADALQFLTGDSWQFDFSSRDGAIYHGRERQLRVKHLYPASTACLFSGGLDSLVGAIDLLEEQDAPVTLVSHYDLGSTARRAQKLLVNLLEQQFPWRINLVQARVGTMPYVAESQGVAGKVQKPQIRETTFRSRSVVFLALGLYTASQHNTQERIIPLLVPENGFIALNPPLTDARMGSCSTKTTHPIFLDKFQNVVRQLGILNKIRNPLVTRSKGEVLTQTLNETLVRELAPYSISCAHPTRRKGWYRRDVSHCGYCVPCLIRRASLHQVGLDQGTDYGFDVWGGELGIKEDIAVDFRAILGWVYDALYNGRSVQSIVKKMNLPGPARDSALQVIQSGFDEMIQIMSEKAEDHIKQWAGLERL